MKALMMILAKNGLSPSEMAKFQSLIPRCECWVIAADSTPNDFTFVYPVSDVVPIPLRIGISINAFILWRNPDFDWLIKVDSDMKVPLGYFDGLENKVVGVYGCGPVMAISRNFFERWLNSRYPINNCDDGYIFALANAIGSMEYVGIPCKVDHPKSRAFYYGVEKYKWGAPFWLSIVNMRNRAIKYHFYELSGWFFAFVGRTRRYWFSSLYRKIIIRKMVKDLLKNSL